MNMKKIKVDFTKKCGKIKPLHCINGGPRSGGGVLRYDFTEEFAEIGIPCVRTELSAGEYGFNQYIDVHAVFPDFDADEQSEESYSFHSTDLYLASVKNSGAQILYRLGESSEPYGRRLYSCLPRDAEKWARICEHIVMHYNEGWASGFKLGIKYLEIPLSPDTAEGRRDYFDFYRTVALYLRERFPKIKLGAFGSRGFAALNRLDATDEQREAVALTQQFLSYINKEATAAPLDFFTWECYSSSPEELAMHIRYARSYLDSAGLRRTKSIICRYNAADARSVPPATKPEFPAIFGASLVLAQKNAVDMMMYSTSDVTSPENALFSVDDFTTHHRYAAYNVMRAFGKLYRLGTAVDTGADYRGELYSLAASSADECRVMLVTREFEGRVELSFADCPFTTCQVVRTDYGRRGVSSEVCSEQLPIPKDRLLIPVRKNEVYLLTLFGK